MNPTRVTISMPPLGEDVSEATISRWLIATGDAIDADAALLEVATDKVDTEIPSPHAGTLIQTLAAEDEVVEVGAALAIIEVASLPEQPVDLAPRPATLEASPDAEDADEPPDVMVPAPDTASTAQTRTVQHAATTVQRLPRIRKLIARRMLESLHTSAQLTTVVEVDVTAIRHLRAATKEEFHHRTGVKLSYLPFFTKATIEALLEHPVLAATVNADCTEITYHRDVHLGIAVDGPKGLMVPVIRDAQNMDVIGLAVAVAIADLADQVRASRISPDALTGGTFTITNTGSRGALFDTPILNQPQSGILGTGAVLERVVPQRDPHGSLGFGVRSMVYLAITYDHRVVDGADAARFLGTIKGRLEAGFTADELADSVGLRS